MQETLLKTKEETRLYKAMLRRNMVQTLLFDQSKRTSHRDRAYEKVEIDLKLSLPVMLLAGRSAQELTDCLLYTSISIIRFWSAGFPAENAVGILSFICFR